MATLLKRPQDGGLTDWMSRFFDEGILPERFLWEPLFAGRHALHLEEYTDNGVLVVRAEMPGLDPDKDVEISLHDGMLHIRAERRETNEQKDRIGYRSEFHYGMFERTLPLPAGSDQADVTATYQDGILEVRVPTKGEAHERATVPVQRKT